MPRGVDCTVAGVETRWTESPLYLAMLDALDACGLTAEAARARITDPKVWTRDGDPEWPSPDPVVRLRFQMLWTVKVQERCGFNPDRATPEGKLTMKAVPLTRRPVPITSEQRQRVVSLYTANDATTTAGVAATLGISRSTVGRQLRLAGIKIRPSDPVAAGRARWERATPEEREAHRQKMLAAAARRGPEKNRAMILHATAMRLQKFRKAA